MILAVFLALALPPSVHPWPIGNGPGFHLASGPAPAHCVRGQRYGAHIELFVRRQVLIVPAGIGVARPWREHLARITPSGCTAAARTLEPTGVIELTRPLTLGAFFRIWGQRLGPSRIAGFRGRVAAFVGGRRWRGDPRRILLTRHAQVVLELGGELPPHPRYLFPPGL